MYEITRWVYVLYLIPMIYSMFYFTIVKIEDKGRKEQVYDKSKFSYKQTLAICLIPLLNILIAALAVGYTFASLIRSK